MIQKCKEPLIGDMWERMRLRHMDSCKKAQELLTVGIAKFSESSTPLCRCVLGMGFSVDDVPIRHGQYFKEFFVAAAESSMEELRMWTNQTMGG